MNESKPSEVTYLALILDALAVCRNYKPKLGKGSRAGFTLDEFQALYQQDIFYMWFGLDSPLVYAAHKAAGGITSVYRQIGIGCERLFRQILQDTLGLDATQASWSYKVPGAQGRERTLSLDGRVPITDIRYPKRQALVREWLKQAATCVRAENKTVNLLQGAVFEVRQGYKSKDSKRQNADIGNAANAYAGLYLPVLTLLSMQIDSDVEERYARSQWLILKGTPAGSPLNSTYVFFRDVLGYDLAGFFSRNSPAIKHEVVAIIGALLR